MFAFVYAPQIADEFVRRFSAAVDALKIGLPWQPGVSITPLPEPQKPALLQELTRDAIAYGPVPATSEEKLALRGRLALTLDS